MERAHERSLARLGRSNDQSDFPARAARFQAELASDEDPLDTARAAEADIARAQAVRARALTAFATRRPVSLDRPDDQVGAAARASRATRPEALRAVSEFCVVEGAVGLSVNPNATGNLLVQSVRLVDRLPGTLAALEAGRIASGHVLIAVELIAPLSAELRALAEEQLLPRAAGRSPQSWRPIVRRLVVKLDADAITPRVAAAVRERKVVVHPAADGMATLCATLPIPVARAVEDALRQQARNAKGPGDERSQGERMADSLVDLLLDPTGHGLTDDTTGELVALTDATGLRRAAREGIGLGPPPEAPGYAPTAALGAFVRLRDRRCQFPGCRVRPTVCDLDHQHPWLDGGRTAHDDLACLCRHHHRLSHQAPGWRLRRTDDGAGLRWQTPTGQVAVTRPTGLASPDPPPF